jgi:hypothetical protein
MTDRQRIAEYLHAQAAKLTPTQLIDKVRNDMQQLRTALLSVPAGRFDERPDPSEWSANEVASHIVLTSESFARAIEAILDGGTPADIPIDVLSEQVEHRSGPDWWHLHLANRQRLFGRVLAADPEAHLEHTVFHPMFGRLNWRETLLFLRIHDLDHARQLEALAAGLP